VTDGRQIASSSERQACQFDLVQPRSQVPRRFAPLDSPDGQHQGRLALAGSEVRQYLLAQVGRPAEQQ